MNLELLQAYGPRMLSGLVTTLELVFISAGIGALMALPLALARNSRSRLLSVPAKCYILFFRGTPLLAQLFLIYYGAGQMRGPLDAFHVWWFFRDAFFCALFAFTINTTAYQAEILRAALGSLPRGQTEAAASLGLGSWVTLVRVLLPQAMILALRPLGNELILSLKASAIASIVTVPELMQATKLAFARSFEFQVYIWAAVIYFLMVEVVRRVWILFERRLTRHLVRAAV
ncbi:ABC transporter permease subunit [Lichenihabitans sp. Uapishka_5]|uniref:ABC transporter permease n=1 Tax=Lichenihabitans sp. Uapishka_5 TaxID=3037302 RepID=UPI0029E81E29|nr:ABC transporter permease subunit [Lichenihabitans sp. Uapishka_5]MDX7952564.1 ABC transporter permease subunit [Lichenihabitans sp. Uapishka_5]